MDPRQQRAVRKGGIKPLTPEPLSLKSKNPKLSNPKSKVKSFWAEFWMLNFGKLCSGSFCAASTGLDFGFGILMDFHFMNFGILDFGSGIFDS